MQRSHSARPGADENGHIARIRQWGNRDTRGKRKNKSLHKVLLRECIDMEYQIAFVVSNGSAPYEVKGMKQAEIE